MTLYFSQGQTHAPMGSLHFPGSGIWRIGCSNGLITSPGSSGNIPMSFHSPRVKQQCPNIMLLLPGSSNNVPISYYFSQGQSNNVPISSHFSQGQIQGCWDVPMGQVLGSKLTTLQLVWLNYLGMSPWDKGGDIGISQLSFTSPRSSLPNLAWQSDYIIIVQRGLLDISIIHAISLINVPLFHYQINVACAVCLVIELQDLGSP